MLSENEIKNIISITDHTNLLPVVTQSDIAKLCDTAMCVKPASVCLPPCFVEFADEYCRGISIGTTVGFPYGLNTRNMKLIETLEALRCGATEIDMVINLGLVKEENYSAMLEEINAVKDTLQVGFLKVAVFTEYLTTEEKIKTCDIISKSDADFICISAPSETELENDVILFKESIKNGKFIKAGGVNTFEQAQKLIELGVDRIGSDVLADMAFNAL